MRLIELELYNFKQYYGNQRIVFAGADEGQKNVTVIYGENGRGKTSLYRALMYCLYGVKSLDQDQNYEKNISENPSIYLVNLKAVGEGGTAGATCYVRTVFEHGGSRYDLRRDCFAVRTSAGELFEEDSGFKLAVTRNDGNTEIFNSQTDIAVREINAVIDQRVASYFLVDGERIDRLTKATREQRLEVASGIRSLLTIDNLDTASKALAVLESKVNRELQKVSTGDYLKKLQEIENSQKNLSAEEAKKQNSEAELLSATKYKTEIDAELERFSEARTFLLQREALESEQEKLKAERLQKLGEMREFAQAASVLLAGDALSSLTAQIDNRRVKGEVPSEIKKELLERLLQEMKCICGRPIQTNSSEYAHILNWYHQANSQVFEAAVIEYFHKLGGTSARIQQDKKRLGELLASFASKDERLDSVALQLEEVAKQIGELPDVDIKKKEAYREKLIKDITLLKANIETSEAAIARLLSAIDKSTKEANELAKQTKVHEELSKKLEIVQRARAGLAEVVAHFVEEVVVELESRANALFKGLIDAAGKVNLSKVRINADYSLDVLDWEGRPFLANISAGQRQVVSMCFILALAQTAGGSSTLEMPLFMDTPFGRLGGEHRDNLLKRLPNEVPQWILLATETEFTTEEARHLRSTGKWGKVYALEVTEPGVTTIQEHIAASFQPVR